MLLMACSMPWVMSTEEFGLITSNRIAFLAMGPLIAKMSCRNLRVLLELVA